MLLGLFLWHLGSLTDGVSAREISQNNLSSSLIEIARNPVNLPLSIVQWVFGLAPITWVFWLRLPSVIFALITIAIIGVILKRWYGPRTALFGLVLFAASAWMLHVGRLATADILFVWAPVVLLWSHLWLHDKPDSKYAFAAWLAVSATLLYIPGMVWLVLLNAVWQRQDVVEAIKSTSVLSKSLTAALGLLLIAPLLLGMFIGSAKIIALSMLGLPQTVPTISQVGHNLLDAVLFIGVRGTAPDDVWLNHLALLNGFVLAMVFIGVVFYAQHLSILRSKLLLSMLGLSIILAAAGGKVSYGIMMPFLILIAAAGIAYMLRLWLTVFPRNQLARGFGVGLIATAVLLSGWYGLRHYFVAWPRHPETQAVFKDADIQRSKL